MILLKKLRLDKGLTGKQVADRAYCSKTVISFAETGKRYPGADILKGIASALGWTEDPTLLLSEVSDDWQWPGAVK